MGFLVPFGGLVVLLMIGFLVLQASAAAVDRPRKVDDEIREAIRQTQFYAEAMAAAKAESLSKPAPSWRDNEEMEEWTPRQEKAVPEGARAFDGSAAEGAMAPRRREGRGQGPQGVRGAF